MPASSTSQLLRRPLPTFHRPTLDGSTFDTNAHGSRVVVVKFFAEYCKPCMKTLPAAEKLHRERPDVLVVGVSEDESPSVARDLVARHGLTFPVVHDPGNVLAGRFRVSEMPVVFVSGPGGEIAWVGGPEQREDALAQAVDSLRRYKVPATPPGPSMMRTAGSDDPDFGRFSYVTNFSSRL
jgi:thiol-disulfide isomerase/thioredoxin